MYYAIGAVLLVTVVIVVLKARKKRQTDAPADPYCLVKPYVPPYIEKE